MAQVLDKVFQFRAAQRIVGLDSVAANGLGDGVLAQTEAVDALASGLEFVGQFKFVGDLLGQLLVAADRTHQRMPAELPSHPGDDYPDMLAVPVNVNGHLLDQLPGIAASTAVIASLESPVRARTKARTRAGARGSRARQQDGRRRAGQDQAGA